MFYRFETLAVERTGIRLIIRREKYNAWGDGRAGESMLIADAHGGPAQNCYAYLAHR